MDEKTRELVKVRLEKADEDIDTAGELLSLKRYRAAVNRAYYALFSITTALLLTKKLDRAKHAGVEAALKMPYFWYGLSAAVGIILIVKSVVIVGGTTGNIKVTPDFLVQGDGNLGGLLAAFLTNKISGTVNPSVAARNASEAKQVEAAR